MLRRPNSALLVAALIACTILLWIGWRSSDPVHEEAAPQPSHVTESLPRPDIGDENVQSESRHETANLEPSAGSTPTGRRIVVTDRATGMPLPKVRAEFWLDGERTGQDGDDAGLIVVAESLARAHARFSCSGYFPAQQSLTALWRGVGGDEPVVVTLSPSGAVEVRVVDEESAPVVGVLVEILPIDTRTGLPRADSPGWPVFLGRGASLDPRGGTRAERLVTDAQGRVRLGELPCFVRMAARAVDGADGTSEPFEIDPVARHATVLVHATRLCAVRGRVLECDGRPVAGKQVVLVGSQTSKEPLVTNADGRFEGFERRGVTGRVVVEGKLEPVSYSCTAGVAELGDIALDGCASLAGWIEFGGRRVEHGTGVGLPSSLAVVADLSNGVTARVPISKDGSFILRAEPGATRLHVTSRLGGRFAVWEGSAPRSDVVIELGASTGRVRLALTASLSRLAVRLYARDDGANAADGRFDVTQSGLVWSVDAQEGKIVELYGVPPGRYDVLIGDEARGFAWTKDVRVTVGGTADLGSVALSHCRVTGKVLSASGAPAPRVTLVSRGLGEPPVSTVSGPEGEFRFESLSPGPRRTHASTANLEDPEQVVWLELSTGEAKNGVVLISPRERRIHGHVSKAGLPVEGAVLSIPQEALADTRGGLRATSDANGTFRLEGVPAAASELVCVWREPFTGSHCVVYSQLSAGKGQEEYVHIELAEFSEPCEVVDGGVVLDDLLSLAALQVSGRFETLPTFRTSSLLPAPPHGSVDFVKVTASRYAGNPLDPWQNGWGVFARLQPLADAGPRRAVVCSGRLRVVLKGDGIEAPQCLVERCGGVAVDLASARNVLTRTQAGKHVYEFRGLPPDCRVRVRANWVGDGELARTLDFSGEVEAELTLP